ncbi:hypothetical protein JQ614_45940 [Bradyrhizobium diazoefficiens]|uniref:hypothetical protein n=1 Tax=Bradyrhizobium diazoefficiens TaxID=1355477 RepID=UPI001B8D72E7|nr:hypothetical protein [Bradyrhizobium diazoefficiens]MBR0868678.1 hypothetical protein [Bradyrhizobium diazoefficiens]MBR0893206.1 hypothetical protein [Bradyrhizobium diazoefficiens]MBR0924933.1 hypothetical protein [Bradyrhizobium diazoefficiens]
MMFTSAKTATACISATILLISVKALAAPLDEYRVACQPSQLAIIAAAMDEARALLKAASNSLPPPNSSIGSKFKRWFGGSDGDNDPKLKQAYTEVEGFLTMKTFWCPNKTMPNRGPTFEMDPGFGTRG